MQESKNKLIAMLQELIQGLKASKQCNLDMEVWYAGREDYEGTDDTLPSCGYAACVIGEVVAFIYAKPEFGTSFKVIADNLRYAKSKNSNTERVAKDVYSTDRTARDISQELDDACDAVFGDYFLVESIYDGDHESRLSDAEYAVLPDSMLVHPHLLSNDPTPAQAIDYISQCIEFIKEYELC